MPTRRSSISKAGATAVLLAALLLGSCAVMGPSRYQTLVWSDEFDGASIDESNWNFDIGTGAPDLNGWGNNELEYYRAENATIEDFPGGGRGLVIEAREESYGGMGYTSSRLNSKGKREFAYGRIEARIRLPEGRGIWPAFWMLGANIESHAWPVCGEIDIMEMVGHEPDTVHGTIHYGDPWNYDGRGYTLASGKFSDGFHVFALEWEPGELRWYVDGDLFSTQRSWYSSADDYPAPFDRPFFILLNLAVGGNWPGSPDGTTVFPQRMYVDYVRVYQ